MPRQWTPEQIIEIAIAAPRLDVIGIGGIEPNSLRTEQDVIFCQFARRVRLQILQRGGDSFDAETRGRRGFFSGAKTLCWDFARN